MEHIQDWFNEKFIPATMKLSEMKYLKALRDGMIVAVPITFIGSIFLILTNLPIPGWSDIIAPFSAQLNVMSGVTIGITGLVMAIDLGYQVSKLNEIDPLSGTAIVVICYIIAMLNGKYEIDPGQWGSGGIFTAIIISIVAAEIMRFFYKHKITIKLPSSVPPAVFNSFAALIPASVAILVIWFVRVGLNIDMNAIINSMFAPLVVGLNSIWGVLIMSFLTCLLWMFGIHGNNAIGWVATPVWTAALTANMEAFAAGKDIPNIVCDGFGNFGMNIGGTGAIMGLSICMMFFAKSKRYKTLGKIAFPPSIFQISEPIMFGFPVVLNPIIAIPFIIAPLILQGLSYFLMSAGLIGHVVASVPWTCPPIINGFLLTGGDWRAALWSGIQVVLAVLIYFPFFKVCDRQAVKEEQEDALEDTIENEEVNGAIFGGKEEIYE